MSVCSIKTHVGNIIPRGALLFHSLFVYTNFYASILMVKNHESSFISLELCSLNIIPTLQLKKLLGFYTSCFSVSTKKSWHIYKGKRLAIRAGSKPTYYRQKVPCIHHFHAWNLKEIRKFLWFSKVFPGPCLVSVRPKKGNQKLCLLNKR